MMLELSETNHIVAIGERGKRLFRRRALRAATCTCVLRPVEMVHLKMARIYSVLLLVEGVNAQMNLSIKRTATESILTHVVFETSAPGLGVHLASVRLLYRERAWLVQLTQAHVVLSQWFS